MFDDAHGDGRAPGLRLARAKQWWHDVLGRDPVYEDRRGRGAVLRLGGTARDGLPRRDFAGTAKNTALNLDDRRPRPRHDRSCARTASCSTTTTCRA